MAQFTIQNLTFSYQATPDRPALHGVCLTVEQGEYVALCGRSGSGKTTLLRHLKTVLTPHGKRSGEILFDGRPISLISREQLTGSLAVVDQDIVIFEDTIADNIRMWDTSIEDFEVILAAWDAQIYDDLMLREGGFQYKLTEGGRDLSGGQRQRLEIARVLAQDPTIIIMDEATSALDAKTEHQVVEAIRKRGITCIVVAHRLSTIRDCDEILVLDHGVVVERGTHEELYAKGGRYTQLVTSE